MSKIVCRNQQTVKNLEFGVSVATDSQEKNYYIFGVYSFAFCYPNILYITLFFRENLIGEMCRCHICLWKDIEIARSGH